MDQTFYHTRNCPICSKNCKDYNTAVLSPFISHRLIGYGYIEIKKNWRLKDYSIGNNYLPCESVFCNKCKFLFSSLRFNKTQMNQIYSKYRKKNYIKIRSKYEKNYTKRNNILEKEYTYIEEIEKFILKFIKLPKKIIDYGGDTGKNTPFKTTVKKFDVFDISKIITIKKANKVNINQVRNKKYDLFICAHVIEHTPKILNFLENIFKNVTSKSYYFELPYEKIMYTFEKKNFLKIKRHWHEHINFYTIHSIKLLFKKVGFKIIKIDFISVKDTENNKSKIIRALVKK